jgi:hypothetical protein
MKPLPPVPAGAWFAQDPARDYLLCRRLLPPISFVYRTSGKIGMWLLTRQTAVNTVMLAAALAVVAAIIFMRPAARVARGATAQSAVLSAVDVTPVPENQ